MDWEPDMVAHLVPSGWSLLPCRLWLSGLQCSAPDVRPFCILFVAISLISPSVVLLQP